ncbi:transposase [uncultured Lamprocystis sp.]|jgi:hypothetical protein|uniref:transposase n=1 Tax=uncultured Lamprocystis sp. TaxID=543132 RepID=UPI0025E03030|nr:transposase [uncultured Lamprocystis sp.]
MALLPPGWPILVVVDETLERRKGARIAAKGMYRDAVRSSKSRVVTCLGLHWICMELIVPVPWSRRPWALPFLTLLAPSQRANVAAGKAHRTVWASLPRSTAWYLKPQATFSDCLALVRRTIWAEGE